MSIVLSNTVWALKPYIYRKHDRRFYILLNNIRLPFRRVMHDNVVCWGDCTLANMLADQEEIIPGRKGR